MSHSGSHPEIRSAIESDVPEILSLIRSLAEYEKLTHMVQADEARLRETLFGEKPAAEVLLAFDQGECAGFAVFFPTYSTFLARPGLYLEDLFVHPHLRRRGIGLALLKRLARLASGGQLLAVTHSPQVAARGTTHYVIAKSSEGTVTRTGVARLDGGGRRQEIARMLSGAEITEEARAQADRLLEGV